LGTTQRQVLDYIKQHKGCTQTDIVNGLEKQKSQISNIIGKLCSEGYIFKEGKALFIVNPC
jgi:uncharacterized membrane protein